MKCPICGKENAPEAETCGRCGFGLLTVPRSTAEVPGSHRIWPQVSEPEPDQVPEAVQAPAAGLDSEPVEPLPAAVAPVQEESPSPTRVPSGSGESRPVRSPARPSAKDRIVGIVNLVFGAFLIVAHVLVPVIGCLAGGEELTNAIMEPAMIAAMIAVAIVVAGRERMAGHRVLFRDWAYAMDVGTWGGRGYSFASAVLWVLWQALPYLVALVAPFHILGYICANSSG